MRVLKAILTIGASLALVPCTAGVASAVTVTLSGSTFLSLEAGDGAGNDDIQQIFPSSIPFNDSNTALGGGSSASATYALSNDRFAITSEQVRGAGFGNIPFSEVFNNVVFTVSEDVGYVLSGSLSATDAEGRQTRLFGLLRDTTNGMDLFSSDQVSSATVNESFVLGGSGGDFFNSSSGTLTGTLLAGNLYQLRTVAFIQAAPGGASQLSTASGSVTLTFVPEPSTASLMGLGLCALGAMRRRPIRVVSSLH